MTASKVDITFEQGADFQQVFPIIDPSITSAELTGASAVMQFRPQYGDPTAILTLTTADGSLSIDAPSRAITASIAWAFTEALLAGTGVHDIKLQTTSGKHKRTHQGSYCISPAVTLAEPPTPSPGPSPSPDVYGTSGGDEYGNSSGDTYGPN